jgi:LysM repeat protein
MKKITESQLIEQARGLRAYLSDAAVVSGDGTPVTSGNGTQVQSGKPAPAAPAAPGVNPWEGKDPAKAAAWAKLSPQVQKKLGMADPTDPYIISRMTKGELGGLFGGGATDANPDGTAKTVPGAAANAAAATATTADLAQLKTLIAQLTSMSGQGAKTPVTNPKQRTPAEIQASKDLGDFAGESLNESMSRLIAKLTVLEDAPQTATMPATPAAAPAGDKAAIVQQIQAIMARINSNNENPSRDIAAALGDAQKAIDTANAAPAAVVPPAPVAGGDAKTPVAASGYKGSPGAQAIQKLNPSVTDVNKIMPGQTLKMPNGKDYVVQKGDTLDGIAAKNSAPAAPSAPSQGAKTNPPLSGITDKAPPLKTPIAPPAAAPAQPAAPAPEKKGWFSNLFGGNKPAAPTQESVTFSNESESLARIIDLARR